MHNKTRRSNKSKQRKNKTIKNHGGFFGIFKKRDPKYDSTKKEMNSIVNIYYHAKKRIPNKIDSEVIHAIKAFEPKVGNYNPSPERIQELNNVFLKKKKQKGNSYWCNQQWRFSVYDNPHEEMMCRNGWTQEDYQNLYDKSKSQNKVPESVFSKLNSADKYTICRVFKSRNPQSCRRYGNL